MAGFEKADRRSLHPQSVWSITGSERCQRPDLRNQPPHATHPAPAPHSVALRSAGLAASALARIVNIFGAVV